MSFTTDSILALLALIVMLAPAARYIYRLVRRLQRRRRQLSADVEGARMYAPNSAPAQLQSMSLRALELICCPVVLFDTAGPGSSPSLTQPREYTQAPDGVFNVGRATPVGADRVRATHPRVDMSDNLALQQAGNIYINVTTYPV
jgi:hypothetical protein